MVIDVIMFNGEYDLFDIRYNILKDHVDQFIVCEARTTFSGKSKPLYFPRGKYPDVKYYVISQKFTDEEIKQANDSPNTQGADHWTNEFLQKESIKKALTHLKDNDLVYIGDCDEIPFPWKDEPWFIDEVWKLKLRVYTYYLNNRSSEEFWGPIMGFYRNIKNQCLNHLRSNSYKTKEDFGWHFTSMAHDLKRKLEDSYTEESYATPAVMEHLEENVKNNKDFLGRDFTYEINETDWPPWLKEHRLDYLHLLK